MRRGEALLGCVLVVAPTLGGCRAVIGVEDQGLSDGGADGALVDGARPEAGAHDGSSPQDAASNDSATADGPTDSCDTMQGLACAGCCRMTYGADYNQLENDARMSGCICGPNPCSSECSTTTCAMPPGSGMPPMTCAACVDTQLLSGNVACNAALDACTQSSSCAPAAQCLKRCP